MILFYIYFDNLTKQYEIYQTREQNLVGTSDSDGVHYFACFSRSLDASRYVQAENKNLHK